MIAACAAAVVLGAALRWWNLAAPLAPMEALTAQESTVPLAELLSRLPYDHAIADPPLFTLLANFWDKAFGSSAASLHALAALCGTLALASAYWAGDKLGGKRAAWACAAVAALHPTAVAYSVEARSYALLFALELAAIGALAEAARLGRARDWALFYVLLLAACFTHYFGIFFSAALLLSALVLARPTNAALAGAAASAFAYAFWLPSLLRHAAHPHLAVEPLEPAAAAAALAGAAVSIEHASTGWPAAFFPHAALAAAALGGVLWWNAPREARRPLAGLAAAAVLTVALPAALSLAWPIFAWGRHVNAALAPLVLFWGWALAVAPKRWAGYAGSALAALTTPVLAGVMQEPRTILPEVSQYVRAFSHAGDAILVRPKGRKVLLELPEGRPDTVCGRKKPRRAVVVLVYPARRAPASDNCEWETLRKRYRVSRQAEIGGLARVVVYDRF